MGADRHNPGTRGGTCIEGEAATCIIEPAHFLARLGRLPCTRVNGVQAESRL